MAEPTLNQAIQTLCTDEINRQRPLPSKVTITAIHNDGYIDIVNSNDEIIKNIECIGNPTVNATGLLITIENNEQVVIT